MDDETDLVAALTMRLQAEGDLELRTAADGASGLALAAEWRPDVVVLDVAMPGIDGWEFCRRLRLDPATRAIPVLIATAWLAPGMQERAVSLGVAGVLLKPMDERELVDEVRRLAKAPVATREA